MLRRGARTTQYPISFEYHGYSIPLRLRGVPGKATDKITRA